MSEPTIWELPTRHIGRRVEVFERLASTNALALERCGDPASDGLAILAREQTAGRGQHGRSWQAPAGSSVLLSVILFPPVPLRRPALLTAWAAVSVCEVIHEATGLQPGIKWPNDVLVNDKKVCGILIEQRNAGIRAATVRERPCTPGPLPYGRGSDVVAVVAGIGLNVRQTADFFGDAQLPWGGSLFTLTGKPLDSEDIARRLLNRLDHLYARLLHGDFAELEETWRQRLGLLHKHVSVELVNGQQQGILREIALDGLALELDTGQVLQLQPEAVRHLAISPAPS